MTATRSYILAAMAMALKCSSQAVPPVATTPSRTL
eukprot:CAMPEP_0169175310 /NCGR_PEP_ID=MMETSP1015-20121227/65116_1 /TAXON_ID=342587 /ORGANISM="Karlodinium micrum, Strain CCMP2283" /LENGTH=34 /DNA_ID= /DNA_START= /DNA_END= /DNA_ORIENTATION=